MLRNIQKGTEGRVQLIMFPFAGGSVYSYLSVIEHLSPAFDISSIQLPGRADRIKEKPFHSLEKLVEKLLPDLISEISGPYILFGHSMGGYIAYETSRQLQLFDGPLPIHTVLSGCSPFQYPLNTPAIHEFSDKAFIEKIRSLGATPDELINNDEMMSILVPTLKADFKMVSDYREHFRITEKLLGKVSILSAQRDPFTPVASLPLWQELYRQQISITMFQGSHFYLFENTDSACNVLNALVNQ